MKNRLVIKGVLVLILALSIMAIVSAQDATAIDLADGATTVVSDGVVVNGDIVTITAPGTYNLQGSLSDGQVVVSVASGSVKLSFEGAAIHNTNAPALLVESADAVELSLGADTENVLSTSMAYDTADGAFNAAVYSTVDLTIDGEGVLTINADSVDGIASSAAVTVNGDLLLNIDAGDDAIQVATVFTLTTGELNLVAAGGMETVLDEETTLSAKGIKAGDLIVVEDGIVTINAADDAFNSDNDFVMDAGTLTLSATGKGVHADYNLEINGGVINVLNCDEGLEAGFITINDGDINIVASDDGINISEPDDIANPSLYYLYIHGGRIVIDAEGDGIDSNGSIEVTGGVIIVNGPTGFDNGALDYDGIFEISGGTLVAAGSAGMAAAPGETSSQYSVMISFDEVLDAGTLVHIQNSAGEELLTFAPGKMFQSIVFSSPALVEGETYTVYYGGSSDGVVADGLYTGGSYVDGEQFAEFTISSVLTRVGEMQGMFGPGGGMGPDGEGMPPGGEGMPFDGEGMPPGGGEGMPPDGGEGMPPGGEGMPPGGEPPQAPPDTNETGS